MFRKQLTEKQEELNAKNRLFKMMQAEGTLPMMRGNVDSSYEFPEAEKNHWHIRIIKKIHIPEESRYQELIETQIFNTRELGQLLPSGRWDEKKGVGKLINMAENKRILHNPFLKEEAKPEAKKGKKEEPKTEE